MATHTATVYVAGKDEELHTTLERLCRDAGHIVENLAHVEEFRSDTTGEGPCCLVFATSEPDTEGRQVLERVRDAPCPTPVVLVCPAGDLPTVVRTMRAGAFDFLVPPVAPEVLVEGVGAALRANEAWRKKNAKLLAIDGRVKRLTARERQVVDFVLQGLNNKQIAMELGVSSQAIDARRNGAMNKLGVESVARMTEVMLRHLHRF